MKIKKIIWKDEKEELNLSQISYLFKGIIIVKYEEIAKGYITWHDGYWYYWTDIGYEEADYYADSLPFLVELIRKNRFEPELEMICFDA